MKRCYYSKGFALPVATIAMAGLLILALTLLGIMRLERSSASAWKYHQQALLAAEAALAHSKTLLAEVCASDLFHIVRVEDPTTAPYYYALYPDAHTPTVRHCLPLFSSNHIPNNSNAGSPILLPSPTPTSSQNTQTILEKNIPFQEAKTLVWIPITNAKGKPIARYAYWIEDLQGYLNPSLAGNIGPQGRHQRSLQRSFPAGMGLDKAGLFTLTNQSNQDTTDNPIHKLIHGREWMVSDPSLMSIMQASAPLERNDKGHLNNPHLRSIEENLSVLPQGYDEQALIPPHQAISQRMWYQKKLNLNSLLAMPRNEAIHAFANHIKEALRDFAFRKGGFGEDYLKTLGANALDYADKDNMPSYKKNTYRGLENAPLVSEYIVYLHHKGNITKKNIPYIHFTVGVYVELHNPSNLHATGNVEMDYSVHYSFPLGANPNINLSAPKILDDDTISQHNLVKKHGGYYFPALAVSLPPNAYHVYKIGEVDYTLPKGAIPSNFSLPDDSTSSYNLYWNGIRYDWAGSKIYRKAFTSFHKGKKDGRATIPGHSYQNIHSGDYANNMGDMRMSPYIQTTQAPNAYPENYSPNGRNVRYGSIYKKNPLRIYGRVLPSEWPDGGHNAPYNAPFYYTTSYRYKPDDARFMNNPPPTMESMAPMTLSNRGYFLSPTELGNVYDPVMWDCHVTLSDSSNWANISMKASKSSVHGGGNTLRIGRFEHPKFDEPGRRASHLLELFCAGKAEDASMDTTQQKEALNSPLSHINGHVNINTASKEVLRTLLAGFLTKDTMLSKAGRVYDPHTCAPPTQSIKLSAPTIQAEGDRIAQAIINARPLLTKGQLATIKDSNQQPIWGNKALYSQGMAIEWNDAAAEELFSRIYNSTTVRSRNFRIFIVAQSLNRHGKPTATVRQSAVLFADPGLRDLEGALIPKNLRIQTSHVTHY